MHSVDYGEHIILFDRIAFLYLDFGNRAIAGCVDGNLH